jgi:hypothetical protein
VERKLIVVMTIVWLVLFIGGLMWAASEIAGCRLW